MTTQKHEKSEDKNKSYTNIVLNSLPERELEIIGEITAAKMALMREKALKKFKEGIELPGFRKGNAPDNLVAQKVGELTLLEEAAEIALNEEYPNILEEYNIDAIGRPEITITKIAIGNPLGFKVKTALMPEVKLGDYKKIANNVYKTEIETPQVSDQEIEDVILTIRKNIAHQKMHADIGMDQHSHDHGEIKDEDLPELNDEFAGMIGGFKNVAELKEKVKENIRTEKSLKEKDKKRTDTLEGIIADSTIELPKIIVDGELEKMMVQFKDDLGRAGVKYEEYLTHIKKTESDVLNEWHDTAVKRAKSQIILNTIAKEEGLTPEEETIQKEMEHILNHHKEAERFRVRMYVETFLTNEMVFSFLEEKGDKKQNTKKEDKTKK